MGGAKRRLAGGQASPCKRKCGAACAGDGQCVGAGRGGEVCGESAAQVERLEGVKRAGFAALHGEPRALSAQWRPRTVSDMPKVRGMAEWCDDGGGVCVLGPQSTGRACAGRAQGLGWEDVSLWKVGVGGAGCYRRCHGSSCALVACVLLRRMCLCWASGAPSYIRE